MTLTTSGLLHANHDAELLGRARSVVALTFAMDESEIDDQLSQQTCGRWTSLAHMMLLVALESEFGINFDMSEMSSIDSLPKIVESLARHGA